MTTGGWPRPSGIQVLLAAAAVVSYAVGYPLALSAHWGGGWVLVMLGGVFLLALGVMTIRRISRDGGHQRE